MMGTESLRPSLSNRGTNARFGLERRCPGLPSWASRSCPQFPFIKESGFPSLPSNKLISHGKKNPQNCHCQTGIHRPTEMHAERDTKKDRLTERCTDTPTQTWTHGRDKHLETESPGVRARDTEHRRSADSSPGSHHSGLPGTLASLPAPHVGPGEGGQSLHGDLPSVGKGSPVSRILAKQQQQMTVENDFSDR